MILKIEFAPQHIFKITFANQQTEQTVRVATLSQNNYTLRYGFGDKQIAAKNGASAYDIAVKNGFVGDESKWIKSLKSDNKDSGDMIWSSTNW